MKIAVASDNKEVAGHFGHCAGFTIFDIDKDVIVKEVFIDNPGHKPGFLPVFLHEKGVNVIIAGGIGGGAIDLFNEKQIEVVTGASGNVRLVVENYINGKLKSTGSICHEHQHAGSCNE